MSDIDPATLAALQAMLAKQQAPPANKLNPNVVLLAVVIIAVAVGYFYFSRDGGGSDPDKPDRSSYAQQLDDIFEGDNATNNRQYFGYAVRHLAELLEVDRGSSTPSFVTVGEVRGPLSAETLRFIYRGQLKDDLSRSQRDELTKLWTDIFNASLPQSKFKDSDTLPPQALSDAVAELNKLAAAAGVQ